jgi:hypothetical protein
MESPLGNLIGLAQLLRDTNRIINIAEWRGKQAKLLLLKL